MYMYPEEVKDFEIRRKLRKMRWVRFTCGCTVRDIFIIPEKCKVHDKGVFMTGPMLPYGEPFLINSRNLC